jgi:ACS family hexuronate transporter-like MFS transporter
VWYFCLFWLPGYLEENSGFTSVQVGWFGWIPFMFAAVFGIGSGMISDRLARGGMASLRARKLVCTAAAALMPLCALIPRLGNPLLVVALFSLVCAVCLSWQFAVPVMMTETFPTRNVSGVLGIAAGCGAGGAVVFNFFVGRAFTTIGPVAIFTVMGGLHLLACIVLWTMVRRETPPPAAS